MYNDNVSVLGAGTTAGGAVAALPLTSGNMLFSSILVGVAVVAVVVLTVRVAKIVSARKEV